jgi:CRP/FNR family transcriptional regulator, cyclic AMP receptor protein
MFAPPIPTVEERQAIDQGQWFQTLSPSLRHDIWRVAQIRRFKDGQLITARGDPPEYWAGVAKGAVKVSSTSVTGKLVTLTYVEPGTWFGDTAMFDGGKRTHDGHAHGDTSLLTVARTQLQDIMSRHVELTEALLRLQARRVRILFGLVEDLNALPLRARLAKQLVHLSRSYGMPAEAGGGVRIGLQLAQEELAHLLGASRQRVNQELKQMEREGLIRLEPLGLIVLSREGLLEIPHQDD